MAEQSFYPIFNSRLSWPYLEGGTQALAFERREDAVEYATGIQSVPEEAMPVSDLKLLCFRTGAEEIMVYDNPEAEDGAIIQLNPHDSMNRALLATGKYQNVIGARKLSVFTQQPTYEALAELMETDVILSMVIVNGIKLRYQIAASGGEKAFLAFTDETEFDLFQQTAEKSNPYLVSMQKALKIIGRRGLLFNCGSGKGFYLSPTALNGMKKKYREAKK